MITPSKHYLQNDPLVFDLAELSIPNASKIRQKNEKAQLDSARKSKEAKNSQFESVKKSSEASKTLVENEKKPK